MRQILLHDFLLNPAIYIFLLLVFVGCKTVRSTLKWERLVAFTALLLLLGFFSPLSKLLLTLTERQYPILQQVPKEVGHIVVLGSGGTPDEELKIHQYVAGSMLARILEGVQLWKGRPETLLVFSSAGREGFVSQAMIYAAIAKDLGVRTEKIQKIDQGKNTLGEAIDFKRHFPEVREIVLVTSAAHIPRAKRIFELQGIKVYPAPTDYSIRKHPAGDKVAWLPQMESIIRWRTLFHEWGGRLEVEIRSFFGMGKGVFSK